MIRIRRFQSNDEEQVIAIWQACHLIIPQNNPHTDIQKKTTFQPDLFLVAVNEDQILGTVMAGYEGHRGWINYLAVDPVHQGMGIGRLLMENAETLLKELGCPKINLQVRSANKEVIELYQKLGYQVEDIISLGKRFE